MNNFCVSDSYIVQKLAGNYDIYKTTLHIPHPYSDGMAEKWISSHLADFYNNKSLTLAIRTKNEDKLIGAISLGVNTTNNRAELGYWIGIPYWNQGYCTEASKYVIKYGFDVLNLHKITSSYISTNQSSGRVMEKIGMQKEGEHKDLLSKTESFAL